MTEIPAQEGEYQFFRVVDPVRAAALQAAVSIYRLVADVDLEQEGLIGEEADG